MTEYENLMKLEKFLAPYFKNTEEVRLSIVSDDYFNLYGVRKYYQDFRKDLRLSLNFKVYSIKKVKHIVHI